MAYRRQRISKFKSSSLMPGSRHPSIFGYVELVQLGLKIFSATKSKERETLGDQITAWIRSHPDYTILDKIVTQSSDRAFHCVAITIFFEFEPK